jgi:hypothetical protein
MTEGVPVERGSGLIGEGAGVGWGRLPGGFLLHALQAVHLLLAAEGHSQCPGIVLKPRMKSSKNVKLLSSKKRVLGTSKHVIPEFLFV